MAKPASKTLIGAFVVGAVALVVAAVALFGSGKLFAERPRFVMYFPGSVNGLEIGSPVQFRGVKIGEVAEVSAKIDRNLRVVIPVIAEVDQGSMGVPEEIKREIAGRRYPYIQRLIAMGLKAQLRMKSLITGQLYVAVDFYPDKPIRLLGLDKRYPEIPTIPSTSEVLMASLEQVPLTDITNKLLKVTEGIERIVNSPEIKGSVKSLDKDLKVLGDLIRNLNGEIKPTLANLRDTSTAARGAFAQAEKTLAFNEGAPGKTVESLQKTLEDLRRAIASYEKLADRNVDIGYDLTKTLQEIDGAAKSIRALADYLERHPESIVKGKKPAKGE
ncbi:MAG: MlaD family protein [Geobacteraceae bacterium]|nr:MlaD family protein [Geobacteraceae bacterium]